MIAFLYNVNMGLTSKTASSASVIPDPISVLLALQRCRLPALIFQYNIFVGNQIKYCYRTPAEKMSGVS